ncbi:DUF2807 domain-containing protein [Subsaximicrobium wynnwilliamsii]|uniref:DUF2807 domain-containing protein n=1 Tax=Subsaximicrobium wynnwilliamsii TaxID=291179 RepID=A0A5C6ZRM2_9FLAO|nr:DUF2807 domain-containing protein [Subsaximicrobium wynnwilliamsii]TXD85197.1 DUF2807 domain-containing protein [Subsaximicrobium wynnwilliamsii]TXD91240.1 DUF2807 domain-containing protein [Subsaximicrobium wynnwilliamsii]TXE04633.1 DUF2807 domain-containing protein [Subsaximicrobium wynnwilliamsii]
MRRFIFILATILSCPGLVSAQELEKVKGNRELTIKQTYVDEFEKIVVGQDFEVELFYNKKPSVEIETDDNLHEYIEIQVVAGVLSLKSVGDIRPKQLNIKINYGETFKDIEVNDDAEIRSLTSLELTNANLKTTGSSRAYLNIKADQFNFTALDKAKVKLNITANNASIIMSDNARMDALINAPETKIDLYQRVNANVEGTATNLTIRTDNDSQFDGKNFSVKNCTVNAEVSSEVTTEVMEQINIEASGSSEIYLYGNPKITINRFTESAKLQKKEK